MLNERSFIPDEYDTEMEDYSSQNDETYEERPVKTKKTIVEDLGSETTALVQQDSGDSDADKHKGCKYTVLTRAYLTFYYGTNGFCSTSPEALFDLDKCSLTSKTFARFVGQMAPMKIIFLNSCYKSWCINEHLLYLSP